MNTICNISENRWVRTVLWMLFGVMIAMVASEALAEGGDAGAASNNVTIVLCNAITFFQGGVGKSVAIIVMISIAVMMFLGKITWGVAIAVAVGMGLMFGAESVVQFASGDTTPICTNVKGAPQALS